MQYNNEDDGHLTNLDVYKDMINITFNNSDLIQMLNDKDMFIIDTTDKVKELKQDVLELILDITNYKDDI